MIFHLNIFTALILPSRTPHTIIDAEERVVSSLAGQPNDPQWATVSDGAADDDALQDSPRVRIGHFVFLLD